MDGVTGLKGSQELAKVIGIRREKSARVVRSKDLRNISSLHTYHEEEKEGLVEYMNGLLQQQYSRQQQQYRPINSKSNDIFEHIKDGVLLCRLVNAIQPGLIEDSRINNKEKLSIFEKGENLLLALQVAQEAFNISFVNIGVEDLSEGRPVLVLSVLWQLISIDLRRRVRVHSREIEYLQKDEEDGAGAENDDEEGFLEEHKILLRWVNHHLALANSDRRIRNFSGDLKDSVAYIVLLHQLTPAICTLNALNEPDLLARADLFLETAEHVGCKKFLTSEDIMQGNSRLNFAFLAYLFTKFHQPPKPAERRSAEERLKAQDIELADIHQEVESVNEKINQIQDQIKEGNFQLAVQKEERAKEEKVIQERITTLEESRKKQSKSYAAKIETLKQEVAKAHASQLPSVDQLKIAIANEEKEKEEILKEREELKVKLENVKGDVNVSVAGRTIEEMRLARTTEKVEKMEREHSAKTRTLTEKIDALGITTLQKKLDEAIAQNTAKTETRNVLSKTRASLTEAVVTESEARSKASRARLRVEAELAKAKKNVVEANTSKKLTEAASSRLERKVIDIKGEITKVKKDIIFITHQTESAKENIEDVQEQTQRVAEEKERLEVSKDILLEDTDMLEDEIEVQREAIEAEASRVVEENEIQLEINHKRNLVEIENLTIDNEKASSVLIEAMVDLNKQQIQAASQAARNTTLSSQIAVLGVELDSIQEDMKEDERERSKLQSKNARVRELIEQEEMRMWESEHDNEEMEREKAELEKSVEEKLAKKTELEHLTHVQSLEVHQALSHSNTLASMLADDKSTEQALRSALKERKLSKIPIKEEQRKEAIIESKLQSHARALEKEKAAYEKRLKELSKGEREGESESGESEAMNVKSAELEKDVQRLKEEREALLRQKQELTKTLSEVYEETAPTNKV